MMSAKTFRLFIALMISVSSLSAQTVSEAPAISEWKTDVKTGEEVESTDKSQPNAKQQKPKVPKKKSKGDRTLQGIYLSGDMFGYIYPLFAKDKFYSTEASLMVNLKNRFFPVVEAGYGYADIVSHLYDIGYRAQAPYYRIGMDYNVQYKNGRPNYIYLGGRVGYTTFNYSVDAPALQDPMWGDEVPVQFTDMPCRAVWAEAVGGVRAEIVKNLYMGWSLRYKKPLHTAPIANGGPWYIPGYGVSGKATLGATYTISYYFRL